MAEYTVETTTATVYKIRCGTMGNGWADITIREWPDGGSISIQSDFGDWAYSWNATGGPFRAFLRKLNPGYFFGKCMGKDFYVFDDMKTEKAFKALIIELRRHGELSKEDAFECWEEVVGNAPLHSLDYSSSNALYHSIGDTEHVFEKLCGEDYYSIPVKTSPDFQAMAFWEKIWPVACDAWSAEETEQAA